MTTETINRVLIPGSYDILSTDHKLFISSCIAAAEADMSPAGVVMGLVPDRALHKKGKYRPLFAYEWRQNDISRWFSTQERTQQLEFEEFYPGKLLHSPPPEPKHRLAVLSTEHEGTTIAEATTLLAEKIIYVPPIDIVHTTDIENTLRGERDASYCEWRVGAVLLRDGTVIGQYHNGGSEPDSCKSCSKRIDIQRIEDTTGRVKPSLVPCDFPHTEMQATRAAQPGDHLLTTMSPCQECAEAIVSSGIERVVYLQPYHTTQDPIAFLANNGVKIRQAGYLPEIN